MRYCKLIDEEGFDQFAHLDTLEMVIEHMPDAPLVAILKTRRKGGRRDWPVEAMRMRIGVATIIAGKIPKATIGARRSRGSATSFIWWPTRAASCRLIFAWKKRANPKPGCAGI